MKLRFGTIEQVLQLAHDVPAAMQSQFRARLRNLFRVGLALPSGRVGRRANYYPADLFKMAFAVELLQAGIQPEKAALIVSQYWPDAVEQMFASRAERKHPARACRFLVAEPQALTDSLYRFKGETFESLSQRLRLGRRLIIIDIAGMFIRNIQAAEKAGLDMEAFNASLDEDQAIIQKHGPRTLRPPASGFVEE